LGAGYVASALGFLAILLAGRVLGAQQFAWIAAGIAVGAFAVPLTALGSDFTFVRDAVGKEGDRQIAEMAEVTMGMRATVMLIAASLIGILSFMLASEPKDALAVAMMGWWVALQGAFPAAWFDYSHKIALHSRILVIERLLAVIALCGLWVLPTHWHTPQMVGCVFLLTRLASYCLQVRVWASLMGKNSIGIRLRWPMKTAGISLYATAASLANALYVYGNQLLLAKDPIELASYGMAFQILGVIFVFQAQVGRLMNRSVAEACRRIEMVLPSLTKTALFLGFGSAILAAIAYLAMQFLPVLLGDERYRTLSQLSGVLCIWVVVSGIAIAVVQHLMSLNHELVYCLVSIITGLAGCGLGFALVPSMGGMGVAIALLGTHTIATAVNFSWIVKQTLHKRR
jgi:O-antigen/teichoic acid export membrane protein